MRLEEHLSIGAESDHSLPERRPAHAVRLDEGPGHPALVPQRHEALVHQLDDVGIGEEAVASGLRAGEARQQPGYDQHGPVLRARTRRGFLPLGGPVHLAATSCGELGETPLHPTLLGELDEGEARSHLVEGFSPLLVCLGRSIPLDDPAGAALYQVAAVDAIGGAGSAKVKSEGGRKPARDFQFVLLVARVPLPALDALDVASVQLFDFRAALVG